MFILHSVVNMNLITLLSLCQCIVGPGISSGLSYPYPWDSRFSSAASLSHVAMGFLTSAVCKESLRQIYMRFELTHEHVRSYTKQIVDGLKYLHDQGIICRDIKCANILSERGALNLADFGVAEVVDNFKGTGTQCVGSVHWMAPEVIKGDNVNNLYNHKADIWTLGCMVLEMAAGRLLYGDLENSTVIYKLGRGDLSPIPDYLGEDLKNFISTCLKVNAQERPTCDDLLAHPFIARS